MASHWKGTLTLAALLAALTASPAGAQRTTPDTRTAVPTIEGRAVAVRALGVVNATATAPLQQQRAVLARPLRQSETLMIIGGGLFLTGAIIGDDAGTILMVGGVITGLYGLYQYLQQRPLAPAAAGSDR
jgi:hypothetical protein